MSRTRTRFASVPREQRRHLTRRTLRFAFWEGATGLTALSLAESFFSPLAIALGGTAFQIGMLGAVSQLSASLSQLSTHRFVGWLHSRKRMVLLMVALSALPWLAVALLPHLSLGDPVTWLIPLAAATLVLYHLPFPAWGSWISDLVPLQRRGSYLGMRTAVASVVASVLVLGFGLLLDATRQQLFVAFSVVFLVGMGLRAISLLLLSRMHEPPMRGTMTGPNLSQFIVTLGRTNLGHLVLFISVLYFGVFLAGPFFSIFMLRNLGFSYTTFILLHTVSVMATIVGSRVWGLYADRHGLVAVLRITSVCISTLPLFWLVSQKVPYLIVLNLVAGFAWGGFTLCSLNFVYRAVPSSARTRAVGYFNAFGGIGVFLGATAGGLLVSHLPVLFAHQIMTLFLLSGLVRLAATAFILPSVKESSKATGPLVALPWHRVPLPGHTNGHSALKGLLAHLPALALLSRFLSTHRPF